MISLSILMIPPVTGKFVALVKVIVVCASFMLDARVVLPTAKVTAPAAVVARSGVMSLYTPPPKT